MSRQVRGLLGMIKGLVRGPSGPRTVSNPWHPAAPLSMAHLSRPNHQQQQQFSPSPMSHQAISGHNTAMYVVNSQHAVQHNALHSNVSQCSNPQCVAYNQHTTGITYQPQNVHVHVVASVTSGPTYLHTNQAASASHAQCPQWPQSTQGSSFIHPAAQYIQSHDYPSTQSMTYKKQQDYPPLPPPFQAAPHLSSSGYRATNSTGPQ